jgi:hypothetical protein
MSDEPFYAPNHTAAPRQRQPSEHLWSVRKDGCQLDCELRDHGAWGVEVQVYREREFLYAVAGRPSRDTARSSGGTCQSSPGRTAWPVFLVALPLSDLRRISGLSASLRKPAEHLCPLDVSTGLLDGIGLAVQRLKERASDDVQQCRDCAIGDRIWTA